MKKAIPYSLKASSHNAISAHVLKEKDLFSSGIKKSDLPWSPPNPIEVSPLVSNLSTHRILKSDAATWGSNIPNSYEVEEGFVVHNFKAS